MYTYSVHSIAHISISLIIVTGYCWFVVLLAVIVSFKSFQLIKNMVSVFLKVSSLFVRFSILFLFLPKMFRFRCSINSSLRSSSNSMRSYRPSSLWLFVLFLLFSLLLLNSGPVSKKKTKIRNAPLARIILIVHLSFVIQMYFHPILFFFNRQQKNG